MNYQKKVKNSDMHHGTLMIQNSGSTAGRKT